MSDDAPSFVRGIFAGAIHDDLLFPFPAPLSERDPEETSSRRFRASRGALMSPQDDDRRAIARAVRDAGGYGVTSAILPDETPAMAGERA